MNITSKCADMDIPLYEIFNLNPDDFIDENITDLPFSVRILNRMQGNGVFTLSDLIKLNAWAALTAKRATISCRMSPRPSSPHLVASVSATTPISESTIKRFSAVCGFRAS